jgi:hypothetical protein
MSHVAPKIIGYLAVAAMGLIVCGPYLLRRLFPDWSVPDRWFLPGKLIRDYGAVFAKSTWFSVQRGSVALCQKKDAFFLVFRNSVYTPLGWGVQIFKIELDKVSILEEAIADVKRVQNEKHRGL